MDAALRRPANPGFALIALAFFILPGTWTFYFALVTGYAHGTQGMYGGYRSGRFKLWQIALAILAIYPLATMQVQVLVFTAGLLSVLHFVTDEFHLFKSKVTTLSKIMLPGLLILTLGTLMTFFRMVSKEAVIFTALGLTFALAVIFFSKIKKPVPAEVPILILYPTLILALLFLGPDRTSAVVHLLGLMHFWSWYVEYYQRQLTRNQAGPFLKQSILFFAAFAAIGVTGWVFGNAFAQELLNARYYFAWIIVHCVLSFRSQDVQAWMTKSDEKNLEFAPKSIPAD